MVEMVSVKIHPVDSHVSVIEATLDRLVKQSLAIVSWSTAAKMVNVAISSAHIRRRLYIENISKYA